MNYLGLLGIGLGILTFVIALISLVIALVSKEAMVKAKTKRLVLIMLPIALLLLVVGIRLTMATSKSVKTYMDDAIATTAQRLQAWLNGIFCSARLMMSGR